MVRLELMVERPCGQAKSSNDDDLPLISGDEAKEFVTWHIHSRIERDAIQYFILQALHFVSIVDFPRTCIIVALTP